MGITIDKKKTEINLEYYYKNKPVQPSYNNNCTYYGLNYGLNRCCFWQHFKFFKHIQTLLLLPPQPLTITELLR